MTSAYPAPTIPSVETGTPPKEWSDSVLSSSPARETPATSSISGIKGKDVGPEKEMRREGISAKELGTQESQWNNEPKPPITADQPPVGATVVQTAKQYVPKQGIKITGSSHPSSGGRQAGPSVSLPSSELKGAQPSERTAGVGALPGNLSESSVALLPDERQERAQEASHRQRRDTIKPAVEGADDEPFETKEARTIGDVELPKDEPKGSRPNITEAGAARSVESNTPARSGPGVELQSETSETKSQPTQSEQAAAAAATIGTVGTAPGAKGLGDKQEDVERSGPTSEKAGEDKSLSQDKGATKKVGPGYGSEYHPAQLHPPPPGASAAEYQSPVGAQQRKEEPPTVTESKQASVSGEKKPGFMTMVMGEMTILAGKMSRDEHKVEEGRKIVHGEA